MKKIWKGVYLLLLREADLRVVRLAGLLREEPLRLLAPARRRLDADLFRVTAFAAAFLFLVRAAFLAAACRLAFEIAILKVE